MIPTTAMCRCAAERVGEDCALHLGAGRVWGHLEGLGVLVEG